ncbi:hypothetical protein NC653_015193 [Populus alba x Populus x berolinensis]|uniref:Uncharacterized protein n=1 Tax=Populus alba x Populus x berolinensis TaxID=444605 RepID=A0AAD6QJZ1_9ROSI|nr:hypothetical protein NC653_015193 [Populus alba x Populus x berolinensis]
MIKHQNFTKNDRTSFTVANPFEKNYDRLNVKNWTLHSTSIWTLTIQASLAELHQGMVFMNLDKPAKPPPFFTMKLLLELRGFLTVYEKTGHSVTLDPKVYRYAFGCFCGFRVRRGGNLCIGHMCCAFGVLILGVGVGVYWNMGILCEEGLLYGVRRAGMIWLYGNEAEESSTGEIFQMQQKNWSLFYLACPGYHSKLIHCQK